MFRLKWVGHQSTVRAKLLCSRVLSHGHHAVEGTFDKGGVNGEGTWWYHLLCVELCLPSKKRHTGIPWRYYLQTTAIK